MIDLARWRLWGVLTGGGVAMLVAATVGLWSVARDPEVDVSFAVLGFVGLLLVLGALGVWGGTRVPRGGPRAR